MRPSVVLAAFLGLYCIFSLVDCSDFYQECEDVEEFGNTCVSLTFNDTCDVLVNVTSSAFPGDSLINSWIDIRGSRFICSEERSSASGCQLCVLIDDVELLSPSANISSIGSGNGYWGGVNITLSPSNSTEEDGTGCVYVLLENCRNQSVPLQAQNVSFGCFQNNDTDWSQCFPTVFLSATNTTQCLRISGIADVYLCSSVNFNECDVNYTLTLNDDVLVDISFDLLRSEQILEPRCQPLFYGSDCEVCFEVNQLDVLFSPFTQSNYFNACSTVYFTERCSQLVIFGEEDDLPQIDLGCAAIPASSCHICDTDCNGNGICVEGMCDCYYGWQGWECETAICPNDCSGHGKCEEGLCHCDDHYYGFDCSLECTENMAAGVRLYNREWYELEFTPSSSSTAWKGWIDLPNHIESISLSVGHIRDDYNISTPSSASLEIYVSQFCLSSDPSNHLGTVQLSDSEGSQVEQGEWLYVFSHFEQPNTEGRWFVTVFCTQTDCPFRINFWASDVMSLTRGVKKFSSLTAPHQNLYGVQLPTYAITNIQVKVKYENEVSDDALTAYFWYSPDYFIPMDLNDGYATRLSGPEPIIDSTIYSYSYSGEVNCTTPGLWILMLSPTNTCDDAFNCGTAEVTLLVEETYYCIPSCMNGGVCSQELNNTCVCTSFYQGDRCETPLCLSGCGGHGTCIGPEVCECDAGWSGSMCLDIVHDTTQFPYGPLQGTNVWVIIGVIVILLVLVVVVICLVVLLNANNIDWPSQYDIKKQLVTLPYIGPKIQQAVWPTYTIDDPSAADIALEDLQDAPQPD